MSTKEWPTVTKEQARELSQQGKPLDAVPVEVVLWELQRRYGVIEVWEWGPEPPTPDKLPPGFRSPLDPDAPPGFIPEREGGKSSCADEEPS